MAEEGRAAKIKQRLQALQTAFAYTREADKKLIPLMVAAGGGALVVMLVLFALLGRPLFGSFFGLLAGLLGAMSVFSRRAQKVQYRMMEGRPGAAAALLQSMRGRWEVQPGVAFTRKQDFAHRVIGRPGVVIVGEGSGGRVANLVKQEKRRASRAVGDVPVHEVIIGERDGQVPLRKLQRHLNKLPRKLKRRQVGEVATRLEALRGQEPPIPKGPLPKQLRGKLK